MNSADPTPHRPRFLLLAYACSPTMGSEPGVGWNRALQAARIADTWVICEESRYGPSIRQYLAEKGPVPGLHFHFVPRDVMPDVNNIFGGMAIYHPRDPHWYLPTIGIEPHLHRKGLGSALLTQALSRCDQEQMPAYLESSNSANAALYQRFGFEALGVIRAGDSPPMVPMLRGAR